MARNQVQFQRGYSLFDFMEDYGTEEKYEKSPRLLDGGFLFS